MTQLPDCVSIGGCRCTFRICSGPPGASTTMRHAKNGPASVSSSSIDLIGHFESTPMPPATHSVFGPWKRWCGYVPTRTASHSAFVSCKTAISGAALVIAATPLGSPATPKFMLYVSTRRRGASAGVGAGSPPLAQPTKIKSAAGLMADRLRTARNGCYH
jgi:hypothetical protein